MFVFMVIDIRFKGLKEIFFIGLGIWSDEGDFLRKRIKLREGKRGIERKLLLESCCVCENDFIFFKFIIE